ncbi:hypothetical protein [Glycomyces xiaoerkulensis]|uniref:hypothetical protein n=1 Tax=Glycomyces xiaoerkulensis TaxID=2038139 RepID=UPI000C2588EC|nr:hypothetical protein [Glycomyces xiaoerkulensis]
MNTHPTRAGAAGMAVAGVLFTVYEAVSPRADQTTLEGAESWASPGWSVGHLAAIAGLILIPLAWGSLRGLLEGTRQERTATAAAVLGYIGSGLTISYYGAEVYGLKAIGERAVADRDASLTEVAAAFRMDPTALAVFGTGLALVAAAAVLAAVAVWRSGAVRRWSAVPMATAMALYLPHFFLPHPARIAWGALVTVSALWIAAELWRAASYKARTKTRS